MTRTSTSITPEEIESTFERCPDCGTYAVKITDSHYCNTQFTSNLTDAERDQRITADPYPADETVAIVDQFVGDAFAYHELDADNHSLCTLQTDNPLAYCTRTEAQDDQYAPCQLCQRLRQKREAEQ
ncbi:hypothetical protein ZOD2009_00380 [Haladaptatus paucihalophilus DX253]|uniref:Uncharacterized protein n=1 Tax=Haladaptatus paucihalophilus DX253 TaxID=797209 RepID=E7QMQ8_HALPU|nr:hypothetical protein [Haladaptatus paucihalophilus]EFW94242.1 hypothetical protein ZOD2009_00380 [Haladaptatus paucihalophilus DX253]SHL34828.1 hypothetical protein SAMN05444342_3605 [Haladaptatus paucihalophilus DX253]